MNRTPNLPGADALGDAWDRIVTGQHADASPLEREIHRLHQNVRPTGASSGFRNRLREELMSSYQDRATARPVRFTKRRPLPWLAEIRREVRAPRWLSIAATLALLLVTLLAGYAGLVRPDRHDDRPSVAYLTSPEASPAATELPPWFGSCDRYGPYAPCGGRDEVGRAYLRFYESSDEAKGATQVQLQRWTYEPDTVLEGIGSGDVPAGFAIDFVNDGLYQATFSTEVAVMRRESTSIYRIQYPAAGQTIELGQGDSVTYPLGSLRSIGNPSALGQLTVRTAIFYPGDIEPPTVSAPDGAEASVLGDATLPMPLGQFYVGDVFVSLTYSSPRVDYPFPPQKSDVPWDPYTWILGPVDSQRWDEVLDDGGGGFMLWVEVPRG